MNVTFKMKLKLTQYKSLINIVTNNISQQTWTIRRNSNCSKAGNGMQNSKVLRDGLRIQKKNRYKEAQLNVYEKALISIYGLFIGGKRSGRRISSLTQHKLIKENSTGELISLEKNVTVLSEVADEPASQIKKAAMEKRRRSLRRNSELVRLTSLILLTWIFKRTS